MLTCTLLSVHSVGFKHRAPKGVKAVQKWAADLMGTKDVRLDPKANQVIWGLGVKDVPRRLRFRLERE
jgi:large subunit ribosomal protein L31e